MCYLTVKHNQSKTGSVSYRLKRLEIVTYKSVRSRTNQNVLGSSVLREIKRGVGFSFWRQVSSASFLFLSRRNIIQQGIAIVNVHTRISNVVAVRTVCKTVQEMFNTAYFIILVVYLYITQYTMQLVNVHHVSDYAYD